MAKKSDLVEVQMRILRFENNPAGGQNVFIECKIGMRVWEIQRFLHYDHPVSMEKFKIDLAKTNILPPEETDMLAFVKEESTEPFTLKVKRSTKPSK